MKKFNIGEKVTSTNKYDGAFEKECIYLGLSSDEKYHVVGWIDEDNNPTTKYMNDDYIKLLANVKYIPLPKYHLGDIVYRGQTKLIIVDERSERLQYKAYSTYNGTVFYYNEESLTKEPAEIPEEEIAIIDGALKINEIEDILTVKGDTNDVKTN